MMKASFRGRPKPGEREEMINESLLAHVMRKNRPFASPGTYPLPLPLGDRYPVGTR